MTTRPAARLSALGRSGRILSSGARLGSRAAAGGSLWSVHPSISAPNLITVQLRKALWRVPEFKEAR